MTQWVVLLPSATVLCPFQCKAFRLARGHPISPSVQVVAERKWGNEEMKQKQSSKHSFQLINISHSSPSVHFQFFISYRASI
ncbi:hypothetical protein B0J14DRAFT_98028 [Halenospora varia]|nr:hypothetical protein B0J14DRAFT_98028 [Halenospora varia]